MQQKDEAPARERKDEWETAKESENDNIMSDSFLSDWWASLFVIWYKAVFGFRKIGPPRKKEY